MNWKLIDFCTKFRWDFLKLFPLLAVGSSGNHTRVDWLHSKVFFALLGWISTNCQPNCLARGWYQIRRQPFLKETGNISKASNLHAIRKYNICKYLHITFCMIHFFWPIYNKQTIYDLNQPDF